MEKIDIDTAKMLEYGNEIIKISNDLKTNFDELFKQLENMPNKQWIGNSASEFIRKVKIEEEDYYFSINILKSYGEFLTNSSLKNEKTVSKLKGDYEINI